MTDDTTTTPEAETPAETPAPKAKAAKSKPEPTGPLLPDTTYRVAVSDGVVEFETDSNGDYQPEDERERAALEMLGVKTPEKE